MTGQAQHVVIDGEVVGEPVAAPPPKLRKRWPWLVGGIAGGVALCLAVPVAIAVTVFGLPILHDTIEAGKGASGPAEALLLYQISFNYAGRDGEMRAERIATGRHAKDILKVRKTFLTERDQDIADNPDWVWGEVRVGSAPAGQESYDVDSREADADVTLWFGVGGHPNDGRTDGWYTSDLPWHAKAVKQRDGWRLTEVDIPTWCGMLLPDGKATGYSKCP